LSGISADHIGSDQSSEEHQVSALMDELTRERLLVKELRDEAETLRSSVRTFEQQEQELEQLSAEIRSQKYENDSYKRKLLETENRLNDVKIQFKDFKDAMEVERVKLDQSRSLPIILAGVGGCFISYLLVRSKIELEKQQFKYLKFELENMWINRVREIDTKLEAQIEENQKLKSAMAANSTSYLSVFGKRLL